tara:strand:- start:518 stop:634 length:117 start_codon:yes stop_codon:yes gene_type:complete
MATEIAVTEKESMEERPKEFKISIKFSDQPAFTCNVGD